MTVFLFWLIIFGGPLGLIAYVMWRHLRDARRHAAVVGFMAAGRGEIGTVEERRFTPDEIYRQNEGQR